MSRLELRTPGRAQEVVDLLCRTAEQRLAANPNGVCPVETTKNFVAFARSQTCGKCSPCRIGLAQTVELLEQVLRGTARPDAIKRLEEIARVVEETADCAIGIETAKTLGIALRGFRDDFEAHIQTKRCHNGGQSPIPCVANCPSSVDIPGYLACVHAGRYADAVRVIRKDNPFPSACGYVCEHPCESRCRRGLVDAPLNIRGLKRYAVDFAKEVPQPERMPSTGKKVAIIGGGPSGLTAAYYLALMGHAVTVFEKRKRLGGMIRYGIPDYRYPREALDAEIKSILSLGIEVKLGVDVGKEISYDDLRRDYDALYIAIGAHGDKKLRCKGADAKGVYSAVELLRAVGDGNKPDFRGKRVVVIGGGNVAMDCLRSAVRFGAEKVTCVYRRRKEDMTALPEEIEGAVGEGVEFLTLHAPVEIETDMHGVAVELWIQPQIVGLHGADGRPQPFNAAAPATRVPADVVLMAIGQSVEKEPLEAAGIKLQRWGTISADDSARVEDMPGVFAGGDCVTGPATVIKAIAAGKVAAANIDEYLGYRHEIQLSVDIPSPHFYNLNACGRVNMLEREFCERKNDAACVELGMSEQEARQESSRCLRCDHFGYGRFRGGREGKW